jgi:3'-phosphoadenosine 5'-phosphosulfate sulfotransferase (PAPS reductase)/FAD synthetase
MKTTIKKVKIIVPISGGKDSQACLSLAVAKHGAKDVLGLFCDTKFEHQLTYRHIETMKDIYSVDIVRVNGGDVLSECERFKRFPGGGARHCTDKLKIRETKIFLDDYSKQHGAVEVWYGMRHQESGARKAKYAGMIESEKYHPHDLFPRKYPKRLSKAGVMFRLPILDWSTSQVLELLGGKENPLYKHGFDRVGCFPCLMSGDKAKAKAFNFDSFGREQYVKVSALSARIKKPIWTSKGGEGGCMICEI